MAHLDRYQQVRVLGRGAYGSAILVREKNDGKRQLVMKEVDLSRMPASAQQQAKKEVDVLKSLQNPHIVAYYNTFEHGLKLYIVMEFADGGDLAGAVKQRAPEQRYYPESEAVSLFAQCSCAIQYIHSRHILHRDLKCGNIFLTKAGDVKVGDFGIAKVLDSTCAEAVTMIGTPLYLAPEVCDSKPYGMKADVWSLGVVLHEVLALQPPFHAENIASLVMRILNDPPRALPSGLYSQELRNALTAMLQKKPENRPTMDAILEMPFLQDRTAPPVRAVVRDSGGDALATVRPTSGRRRGDERSAVQNPYPASAMRPGRPPAVQPKSRKSPDSLDALMCGQQGQQPHRRSPQPSGGVDVVDEFRRNRELAAQAKARAEGDLRGASPLLSGGPRSRSVEPAAVAAAPAPHRAQSAEAQHLQALQEAAAQARKDRRAVQQRMQELERGAPEAPTGVHGSYEPVQEGAGGYARAPGHDSRRAAEEEHLQALREAALQARQDRRQIQQRRHQQEHGEGREAEARLSTDYSTSDGESACQGAAARKAAESEHLQALQEARSQARRDRLMVQQKMKMLQEGRHDDHQAPPPETPSPGAPEVGSVGFRAETGEEKRQAEEHRMRALQEAAAEARRERQALLQRKRDLEHGTHAAPDTRRFEDAAPDSHADPDSLEADVGSKVSRAEARRVAEEQHLLALQEAAAEARRDRQLLLQRKKEEAELLESRPAAASEAPHAEDLLHVDVRIHEADTTHRRFSRSALRVAGDMISGSAVPSRPASGATSTAASPKPDHTPIVDPVQQLSRILNDMPPAHPDGLDRIADEGCQTSRADHKESGSYPPDSESVLDGGRSSLEKLQMGERLSLSTVLSEALKAGDTDRPLHSSRNSPRLLPEATSTSRKPLGIVPHFTGSTADADATLGSLTYTRTGSFSAVF